MCNICFIFTYNLERHTQKHSDMTSFIKTLVTKEALAEIMLRPLNVNAEAKEITGRIQKKLLLLNTIKFLKQARKATDLDIVTCANKYFIRYAIA